MMVRFLPVFFLVLILGGCNGNSEKSESSDEDSSAVLDDVVATYQVDPGLSVVAWEGKVIGVYGHHGVISIQDGSLTTKGDEITGGMVTIDMKSIIPLDSSSYQNKDGSRITDLQTHLMMSDFFLAKEYPTASFVIKHQENNRLVGDLTIRGITHEETVVLSYLEVLPEGLAGDGKLIFDRQKFGINWKHPVADYILSDDIEVELKIIARKK
ncbi:MAG: YceI family protein [Bacteroidota bacterium]